MASKQQPERKSTPRAKGSRSKDKAHSKKLAPRSLPASTTKASGKRQLPTSVAKAPSVNTVMGRRVIDIRWNGRMVKTVEGRFAYRPTLPERLELSKAAEIFQADVLHCSELDPSGIGILQVSSGGRISKRSRAAAQAASHVHWCEPVMVHEGCMTPNDEHFSAQWGLRAINAERAWDIWQGDPNRVALAILDTGIAMEAKQLSHPDLDDPARFIIGSDLFNKDSDPSDDHGHGTHVAGIASSTTNNGIGIAGLWPGLVIVIKVNNELDTGSDENFKNGVTEAATIAAQRGAHLVINYSSVGPNTQLNQAAVEQAGAAGALLVAPTGNNFGSIGFPAAYSNKFDNVIAVGAVDDQMNRPDFANRGPEMTVVAPGVNIYSTLPNYSVTLNQQGFHTKYDQLTGTSQAAPLVSALAALVWSKWPNLSATQVRDKIVQSATPIAGSPLDFGNGLINAEKALT
jgi:hypothetical protein